jgi:hypothetical protein
VLRFFPSTPPRPYSIFRAPPAHPCCSRLVVPISSSSRPGHPLRTGIGLRVHPYSRARPLPARHRLSEAPAERPIPRAPHLYIHPASLHSSLTFLSHFPRRPKAANISHNKYPFAHSYLSIERPAEISLIGCSRLVFSVPPGVILVSRVVIDFSTLIAAYSIWIAVNLSWLFPKTPRFLCLDNALHYPNTSSLSCSGSNWLNR